jgi:hypothetical protein
VVVMLAVGFFLCQWEEMHTHALRTGAGVCFGVVEAQFTSIWILIMSSLSRTWILVEICGIKVRDMIFFGFFVGWLGLSGTSFCTGLWAARHKARALLQLAPILTQVLVGLLYAWHKPCCLYAVLATIGVTSSFMSCRYILFCVGRVEVPVLRVFFEAGVPALALAAMWVSGILDERMAAILHALHFIYITGRFASFSSQVVKEFCALYGIQFLRVNPKSD